MATMIHANSPASMPAEMQGLPRVLLLTGMVFCFGAHAAPSDTQAEVGYMFDDNVTRAREGGTRLVDRSYSVNLGQPVIVPVADHARALLTGTLGGEVFERYAGLSRLAGAVRGELQYRGSAEFTAPVIALFAGITAEQYRSSLRDGIRYSAGISVRQAVTDRIRLSGAVAHNERNGKSVVFDNRDNTVRLNLDYSLGAAGTIYLGGERRRGDLAISVAGALSTYNRNAYTPDDAFPGGQIYSFRFDGATVLSTLGYNLGIGPRDAIDFSWRRARSSVDYVTPSWSSATMSYVTNQYSAAYLKRF